MVQSLLHFSKSVAPFIKVGRSTLCAEGDGKVAPVSPGSVIYKGLCGGLSPLPDFVYTIYII